jgi:hypothetical protein
MVPCTEISLHNKRIWILEFKILRVLKVNYHIQITKFLWSPKLIEILFKHSVRTAKKTQLFTVTKINWLMLFKEAIAVYSET